MNTSGRLVSLGLVAVALFFAGGAPAATTESTSNLSDAIPREDAKNGGLYMYVGPGLALYDGGTGWAVNFGALTPAYEGSPLFVGADLGIDRWSTSVTQIPNASVSASSTAFQLLPTAIYRFDIAQAPSLHPYVGLSFGPNILVGRGSTTVNGQPAVDKSSTTLYIETLFRPGVFTSLTDSVALQIEPKLGLLGSTFIFLPQVNAFFRI